MTLKLISIKDKEKRSGRTRKKFYVGTYLSLNLLSTFKFVVKRAHYINLGKLKGPWPFDESFSSCRSQSLLDVRTQEPT